MFGFCNSGSGSSDKRMTMDTAREDILDPQMKETLETLEIEVNMILYNIYVYK